MTPQEILEKRIALCQNDINHYNRNIGDLDKKFTLLERTKRGLQQKISKKQVYIGLLEKDIDNIKSSTL